MSKKVKMKECPFHKKRSAYDTSTVNTEECDPEMCSKCGWNPAIDKVRRARIHKGELNSNVMEQVLEINGFDQLFFSRYLKLKDGV